MKATAFVVGSEDGSGATLRQQARQIGFRAVYPFRSIVDAERQCIATPLIYFMFSAADGMDSARLVAGQIRHSGQDIRYAPMIYFAETPSVETIRTCVEIGFDDVIALPVPLSRVEERLDRQVKCPLVYYETATYFGPDRYRFRDGVGHPDRGRGGAHRRYEIVRTTSGVNVRDDDVQIMV